MLKESQAQPALIQKLLFSEQLTSSERFCQSNELFGTSFHGLDLVLQGLNKQAKNYYNNNTPNNNTNKNNFKPTNK